jgi:hypothetical protein
MKYFLLVILLSFLSCTESFKEGIVVSKNHVEQHSERHLVPYYNGRTTMFFPRTRIIMESWNLVVCDSMAIKRNIAVSKSFFYQVKIGDKITIKGDTLLIQNKN